MTENIEFKPLRDQIRSDSAWDEVSNSSSKESFLRLIEFLDLSHDWDDEGSDAPSLDSVIMAARILLDREELRSRAYVYPTRDGGILIEWDHLGWGYSLRVLNAGHFEFFGVEYGGALEKDPGPIAYGDYLVLMDHIGESLKSTA